MTRVRDPIKQRACAAAWREKHREEERQRGKQYRETHRPHLREYMRTWRTKNPDKVRTMSAKSNAKRKEYSKDYYIENRERIRVRTKQRYDANREQILAADKAKWKERHEIIARHKAEAGCQFCNEKNPVCLDFHHIIRGMREFYISRAHSTSINRLEREMKKCIVVCANCHRKIHSGLIDPNGIFRPSHEGS